METFPVNMFYYNQSRKKQNVICCALNVVFCFIPPDNPQDGHDCQYHPFDFSAGMFIFSLNYPPVQEYNF